jgi:hypothetical protein
VRPAVLTDAIAPVLTTPNVDGKQSGPPDVTPRFVFHPLAVLPGTGVACS